MNILIFNWRDNEHPWAGGAERHIHELAKHWISRGHRVTILSGGFKGAKHKEEIDRINVIRVGNTYTIFLLAPLYYLTKLRWRKFDVIIDTAHGIPFFTPLFTRRKKILIIHHDHTRLWQSEWGGKVAQIGRFLENRVTPFLYKNLPVVTLSDSTKEALFRKGYKNITAIPPGIDPTFYNGGRYEKTINPSVLYLGRLRRYKRVDMLVSMFGDLAKSIPGVTLTIAGNGQDRIRILELIRSLNLCDKIICKGFISEEEKRQLLAQSWVFAFPSLIEGWGLVALESAASATPTVGFRVPGVEDAIRDKYSGLLVETKEEFKNALIRIIKDRDLRERLSDNAKKWADRFTWKTSADKFMEVIKS